jgi:hypothetical protein
LIGSIGELAMPPRTLRMLCCTFLTLCFIGSICLLKVSALPVYSGLTAHEWGTFTSIAGADGQAVEWSPLSGSTDLPSFVEHFRNAGFKRGLRGTVRMETPVLYFYAPRQETVSVKVSFANGAITEWYPHANHVEPAAALWDGSLLQDHVDGSIAWDAVTLAPSQTANLPTDHREDRYYAARQTTSTPLRVTTSAGDQYEKFLFYRGAAAFPVPISAVLTPESQICVENLGRYSIPSVILFERRGNKVGYRLAGALPTASGNAGTLPASHAPAGQAPSLNFDPPELTATVDSLAHDLEEILIAQGLYQNEAQAMIETWRDSWFEEGSRLLYIVPPELVNSVLPLTINPAPIQTTRVFVGRLELVTPATLTAVERACATHDATTLASYARFLEPILGTMIEQAPTPHRARQLRDYLNAYYNSEFRRNQSRD